jgi:hypothetical protein
LGRKVAPTLEAQHIGRGGHDEMIGYVEHVARHALKIVGRHGDHGFDGDIRDADFLFVNVQHLQMKRRARVFVGVLDLNPKLVLIVGFDKKGDIVHGSDGFDNLEQMTHVQPHLHAFLTIILFKVFGKQFQMNQRHMRTVHGHHTHTGFIEDEVDVVERLFENVAQRFNHRALNGL